MTPALNHESAPADKNRSPEILYGVKAIADAIDEPDQRRVFYMLAQGHIPGSRKIGRRWALSLRVFRREMHGEVA